MSTLTHPTLWRPPGVKPVRDPRAGAWWRLPRWLGAFSSHLATKSGHLLKTSGPPYHLATGCGAACQWCTGSFHRVYRMVVNNLVMCTGCLNYIDGTGTPFHWNITSATVNGTWDVPYIGTGFTEIGNVCWYQYDLPGFSADYYYGSSSCTPGTYVATCTQAQINLFMNGFSYQVLILGATDCAGTGVAPYTIFQSGGSPGCINATVTGRPNASTTCSSSDWGKNGTVDIIPL